ncbi:MAG: hypothetical protein ABJB12_12930 [Pseudomonadota bacterium]
MIKPATALSGRTREKARSAAVLRLARVSLLGSLMLLFASSCIVADPPEYESPVRTSPLLDVYAASPPTSRLIQANKNDLIKFSVPLRSEDAGEGLRGVFLVDYNTPSELLQNTQELAASTYSDNNLRTVTLDWTVPTLKSGCHLMTLIVAHLSSFKHNPSTVLDPKVSEGDAAIINWWMNVGLDPSLASTLEDCPTPGIPSK